MEMQNLTENPAADVPILKNLLSSAEDNASNAIATEEPVVESPEEEAARKRHEKDV